MIISQVDVTGIAEVERRLGKFKSQAHVVMCRAINDAVSKTLTEMKKVPGDDFHIRQKGVAPSLKPHKASRSRLKGAVSASGERVKLYKFKYKLSDAVVSAAVIKANAPKELVKGEKKAFIASMGNGHTGIFERQGLKHKMETRKKGSSSYITKHNETIRELTGLSVPQMLNNEDALKRINQTASECLNNRLQHHINYILSKG
jgi:hypothetical protein